MNYKKPVMLSDLIALAHVKSDAKYLETINGHELPKSFNAVFILKDKGLAFQVNLDIHIENEKPYLIMMKLFHTGGTKVAIWEELRTGKLNLLERSDLTEEDLYDSAKTSIQARHLTLIAKFHYELIQKAVALAIESEAKNKNKTYTASEIDQIQRELGKTLKRNVPTDSMLKDVAKRYKKAEKAGEPLYDDIMRQYSINERRARELLTMCRRHPNKLLPKKKAGRPSVDKTPTRKKGK